MNLRRFGYVLAIVAAGSLTAVAQDMFGGLENTPRKAPTAKDVDIPEVQGVLVQADFNTDWKDESDAAAQAELKDTIEGSVSFMIDVPFKKIVANMLKPGTLGKISPNISKYEAKVASDTDDAIKYKVHEELVPFKLPFATLGRSSVNLDMSINKRALKAGRLVVDYQLDKELTSDWKRFTGSIYALDLHNGRTMVMVATSTKSNYTILPGLRLKLAKHFLAKTKDNIVNWMKDLETAK
ncbi:MAG: hypothetical protein HY816_16415 [Candidatus Wallbacteria bacterium]|nr:hypothetical protein [Candidatus Wallbacteria bacterium]